MKKAFKVELINYYPKYILLLFYLILIRMLKEFILDY